MTSVVDEHAVVLHTRAYRETSLLVNLLTARHGRVAAVAKGARSPRRGQPLQPFAKLLVSWRGRGSLVTLTGVESVSTAQLRQMRSVSTAELRQMRSVNTPQLYCSRDVYPCCMARFCVKRDLVSVMIYRKF